MWKVLGVDTALVKAGDLWKERMVALSAGRKGRREFLSMLEKADISYWFDAVKEVHAFYVKFPDEVTSEELRRFEKSVTGILSRVSFPVVELEGVAQRYAVVMTAEEEENLPGPRRAERK
ncbi:MAG: hypothetical protein FJ151_01785 [Euryarchaeota archaeon]|nr:hypothetical protein [Euryarchaeota archaeon]